MMGKMKPQERAFLRKVTYQKEPNKAIYMKIRTTKIKETKHVASGMGGAMVMLDFDAKERLVGIEVLLS